MNPIVIDKKDNRAVVLQRGKGPKFERLFFLGIQQMWEEGYRFPENPGNYDLSLRNYRGTSCGRAVMFKGEEKLSEPIKEKPKASEPSEKKRGRPSKNK